MRSLITGVLCFFISNALQAQLKTTLAFEKDSISIAEEVDLILSIETNGEEILAVPRIFLDTIYSAYQTFRSQQDTSKGLKPMQADFELLSTGNWEDRNQDGLFESSEMDWKVSQIGNKKLYESRFRFRFYDPGEIIALAPPVLYQQNGSNEQHYEGGRAIIYITAPEGLDPTTIDSTDIAPIKSIIEEQKNITDYYPFIYGFAGILLALLVYLFWRRVQKKKNTLPVLQEPVLLIPPDELALEKLNILRKKELWQDGFIKEYQSELTHIVREYLEGRYGIAALESTSVEIAGMLRKRGLDKGLSDSLNRILQIADLVKFAKAQPERKIHEEFLDEAIQFVEQTREKPTNSHDQSGTND